MLDTNAKATALLPDLLRLITRRAEVSPQAASYVITEACVLAGHPAKIDRPLEMKTEGQRGCYCGRQPYA